MSLGTERLPCRHTPGVHPEAVPEQPLTFLDLN